MYLSHYDLREKPFQITTDPKFLWLGEKHQEALSILKYGIMENKGFLLLTGEIGTGKTVLINCLTSQVAVTTSIATIPDPDLETLDFFNFLAVGFNLNKKFKTKGDFLIALRNFLMTTHAKDQRAILIIDEAQRLSNKLLEEIRLLSNIELHDKKLINIFFVGQNEFHSTLLAGENKAVAQRISVRFNIEPLTETETGDYIRHRLKVAGTTRKIFKSSAIHEIYAFSGGTPRLINVMCDHALLTGYALGKKLIDARMIRECAVELRIPVQHSKDEDRLRETLESIRTEIAEGIKLGTIRGLNYKTETGENYESVTTKTSDSVEAELLETMEGINPEPLETVGGGEGKNVENRPLWIKGVYAVVVVVLVLFGSLILKNYQPKNEQKWDIEDLTSQKMKDSLNREEQTIKAQLSGDKAVPTTPPVEQSGTGGAGIGKQQEQGATPKVQQNTGTKKFPEPTLGAGGGASGKTVEKKVDFVDLKDLMTPPGNKVIILFQRNSNEIAKGSYYTLDRVAAFMAQHPKAKLTIKGYTDSYGALNYNQRISEFRASTVKSYLGAKGANPGNIKTIGLGPENPRESNKTPQGREANRRVELEFDNPKAKAS